MEAERSVYRALCPRIAVLESEDVTHIAEGNGLRNLTELLRPFEAHTHNVAVRTSQLVSRTYTNFFVRFETPAAFFISSDGAEPGTLDNFLDQVQTRLRAHGQALSGTIPSLVHDHAMDADGRAEKEAYGRASQPWFSDIAEYLYRYRPMRSYDSFSHPQAVILAVSSSNPDPMNAFARLYQETSTGMFAEENVLRCYLVLHDTKKEGNDKQRSMALLQEVKKTYGLQCAMLALNSASAPDPAVQALFAQESNAADSRGAFPAAPDALAKFLSGNDKDQIQAYVRELVVKSMVPYMERSIQRLNEQVGHSRRGFTAKLFGAGRKLFSTRSADTAHSAHRYDVETHTYSPNTITSQTRRLADLAFYMQDFMLASEMYDATRRDAQVDHAVEYSAAAAEMVCITKLLEAAAAQVRPPPMDPLFYACCDEYLHTPSGHLYALRATFLYTSAQKMLSNELSVAHALIHAASFTDEVLRGAVLEQASFAYLCLPTPLERKSASTLLRSAGSYEACGQKTLSLRAYLSVLAFYRNRAWPAITDHVLYKLALQAHNAGHALDAISYLVQLLHGGSKWMAERDEEVVRELLNVYKYASEEAHGPYEISFQTPIWSVADAWIATMGGQMPRFFDLEAQIAAHKIRLGDNTHIAGIEETFTVHLTATNPLHTRLSISNVRLYFSGMQEAAASDETGDIALEAQETRRISIHARIALPGAYRLERITFRLGGTVLVMQSMQKRGPRLQCTKEQRITPAYAPDETLTVQVCEHVPRLAIDLCKLPEKAYAGQRLSLILGLSNPSPAPLSHLALAYAPNEMVLGVPEAQDGDSIQVPAALARPSVHSASVASLAPSSSETLTCALHTMEQGTLHLKWLFVYQNRRGEYFQSACEHILEVLPVLAATTKIRYTPPGYLVYLALENQSDEPIRIPSITCASELYAAIPQTLPCSDALQPGARFTTALRFAPLPHIQADVMLPHALHTLRPFLGMQPEALPARSICFTQTRVCSVSDAPQSGSLFQCPSLYARCRSAWRLRTLAHTYDFLPVSVRADTFSVLESNELDLLVAWVSPSQHGQLYLPGTRLGLRADTAQSFEALAALGKSSGANNMYEETTRERQAILAKLRRSPLFAYSMPLQLDVPTKHISHDFFTGPSVLAAPVTLQLANASPLWSLSYTLRLLPAGAIEKGVKLPVAPWLNATVLRGTIAPCSAIMQWM
ncbi:hypothetical protein MVES_000969 [Malassezia vespertilionis]|uniref:Uncharacterized protein n=1 Tax=Malassezia vespertilionis TaxID=2020962 RepID=A0A2N1JFE6_9BASI|nr:hypothetical protein MVES_000969 [Malassezia vespertilionis]